MPTRLAALRRAVGLAVVCSVLVACSSGPAPAPRDPFEGQSNLGGYPITPTFTTPPLAGTTAPPSPSDTPAVSTTPASAPSLHVDAGFLTARYDCTWPSPAEDDGREVRAPQDAWTNERKTAAPVNTSDFRYTADAVHGGAEAYLIQAWRQSFTNCVRVKAQLTGPRSVRVWVTVPDVPAGYDQRSRAVATPGELVSRYMTVVGSRARGRPPVSPNALKHLGQSGQVGSGRLTEAATLLPCWEPWPSSCRWRWPVPLARSC